MFQTTVKDIMKIPGYDYIHIIGINSKGEARIGDYISDGKMDYEITSIPFVRRSDVISRNEIDICIRPGDYDIKNLLGKTLYIIEN